MTPYNQKKNKLRTLSQPASNIKIRNDLQGSKIRLDLNSPWKLLKMFVPGELSEPAWEKRPSCHGIPDNVLKPLQSSNPELGMHR